MRREVVATGGKQHWQDLPTSIQFWMSVATFGDVDITLGANGAFVELGATPTRYKA